jgi:hypothetical protein
MLTLKKRTAFDGKPAARNEKESGEALKRFKISVSEKIEELSINDKRLHLWKDNPRRNDEAAVKLADIIKVRGQISPIVVWRKNGVIYKGNTTWKAMRILGLDKIKVLWVDFPSEASAIAYGIADNKSSEFSQWDDTILSQFLKVEEIQKSNTGFTVTESNILASLGTTVSDIDPNKEWEGMPEFTVKQKGFKSIVMHFLNQEHVNIFSKLIGQEITENTKYLWYPKQIREVLKKKGFISK